MSLLVCYFVLFNKIILLHIMYIYFLSKENDDQQPKIWYKANSIGNFTKNEVKIDMANDRNSSRVYVSIDHALIIQNLTMADSSFYFCQPYQAQDVEKDLNFYIDGI